MSPRRKKTFELCDIISTSQISSFNQINFFIYFGLNPSIFNKNVC